MKGTVTIFLLMVATPLFAQHDCGNVALSIGGSLSHTFNMDHELNIYAEVTDEYYEDAYVSEPKDYEDTDLSLFFSIGYFVINGLEVGFSGSMINTWYTDDAQEDLEIQDAQIHSKYYFDNESDWTPYVKVNGGMSTIVTGDYNEEDVTAGGAFGLEFSGFGPVSWYAEFSSLCTFNGGDVTGDEWRNQLYFGVSIYFDLFAKRRKRQEQRVEAIQQSERMTLILEDRFKAIDARIEAE